MVDAAPWVSAAFSRAVAGARPAPLDRMVFDRQFEGRGRTTVEVLHIKLSSRVGMTFLKLPQMSLKSTYSDAAASCDCNGAFGSA